MDSENIDTKEEMERRLAERAEEQKTREEKWEEERQAAIKRVEEREAAKKRMAPIKNKESVKERSVNQQKLDKKRAEIAKEAEKIIARRQAAKKREEEAIERQKRPDETDEEWKARLQQIFLNKIRKDPLSVPCNYPGCSKVEYPAFLGSDGKYYCRDHILPENRGMIGKVKPPVNIREIYSRSNVEYKP
jgi:hypothetical protein